MYAGSMGLHPLFLLMAVVGVASGLFVISQRAPLFAPVACAVSTALLLGRVWQLKRPRKRADARDELDFAELRAKNLEQYRDWVRANLRGHDEVVDDVIERVQQRLELASPERTLGAFLLVGPTGTGKTFLAQLISDALYPKSEPVLLRMNQFKHSEDVSTLIGPPPGSPGFDVGGALTRPVLENPYRVVILDELDKCHPDVRHCLYNVLDAGHTRERSTGQDVFFSGCVFFATSNAGAEGLRRAYESTKDPLERVGRGRDAVAAEAGFEKALLARFDAVYLMDELKPMFVAQVACLQLARHWRRYGIELAYAEPEVIVAAMKRNAEFREYGVRQLSQMIQTLTDPAIDEARRAGAVRVRLGVDRSGRITVEAEERA